MSHVDGAGKDITHARFRPTRSVVESDGSVRVERVGRLFGVSRLEVCPSLLGKIRRDTAAADIVHLHTPNPLMLGAWWAAGARDKPLVVTHHSDVVKQRFLNLFVAPIVKRVYGLARRILSDSPNYIEGSLVLQSFAGKVETLPLGIDLEPYLRPSESVLNHTAVIKKEHDSPLWLMVGRMTYYKGYHVAIEALPKVPGKLIIVGNGPLEPELKAQAERIGVGDRIIWMPSVPQEHLVALYRSATALWFPSVAKSEGFGLVQVEAMASGCPVINTAIPGSGVSWVSQDGVSGLTVPVHDSFRLAEAAKRLASDAEMRQKFSDQARKRAAELFDARHMASKCLDFYRGVLGKK